MMANEKRLIDANALIAEYDRVHIGEPGKARKLMEDAPTIDAVEVVRCKDCVSHGNCDSERVFTFYCGISNPFCCAGRRKRNG